MKKINIIIFFLILTGQIIYAQNNRTDYIKKDIFTKVISVTGNGNHGDDFLTINIFRGQLDKVQWGDALTITSYRYLGIDNQNNLHIQRNEHNYTLNTEDTYSLIFKLDTNKPTEITLIDQRSQKNPLLIKVQIEANNNFIKTKYIGDLPIYSN